MPNVAIFRSKTKLFHSTTKVMKYKSNSSVDDWLIVDPDSDISLKQYQKARSYMKINKLNPNKWEKSKPLFAKQVNVDYRNNLSRTDHFNNDSKNLRGKNNERSQ